MDAVELSLLAHRLNALCKEMGAVLKRSALSPNIKDREDFSCALFNANGELVAQAAHIPVHLGSMAFAMQSVVEGMAWSEGDVVVFNDPFLGGTHLPDITVVMPMFHMGQRLGFAACRAHHADIGGRLPGSMGVSTQLADEGIVIPPMHWFRHGKEQPDVPLLLQKARCPQERLGDLSAQRAACLLGVQRLSSIAQTMDLAQGMRMLLSSAERYGRMTIAEIPDGSYAFQDVLDNDGIDDKPLPIRVTIRITGEHAVVDFSGTATQCRGPMNCPLSVTAAAVYYVFRCLMPEGTPESAGIFRPIEIHAPKGSLVNATPGCAVAGGNVETSQRIVDVVCGALAAAIPDCIPAAAQGTMNNILFGTEEWVYYETLGGGMGAHRHGPGLSGVQCHMTNTKNTSIEVLEMHYPLRVHCYAFRSGSGGGGKHRGGDGLIREWEVLAPCSCTVLSERRLHPPYGLQGGKPGETGRNLLWRHGRWKSLPGKFSLELQPGDRLRIESPAGGGFGKNEAS